MNGEVEAQPLAAPRRALCEGGYRPTAGIPQLTYCSCPDGGADTVDQLLTLEINVIGLLLCTQLALPLY